MSAYRWRVIAESSCGGSVIVTLGDLVEDIVVELAGPVNVASDTAARIRRRRGGSAANVAARAATLGHPARFVGQVGDDAIGAAMIAELAATGVDVGHVRRDGATGTIVVLVDAAGERTMLVDPGSARQLAGFDPGCLTGAHSLHVTLYSLIDEPIATTTREAIMVAHSLGVAVSLDVSSVALIEAVGEATVRRWITELTPTLVLANADEARVLGIDGSIGGSCVVVKRGGSPCIVHRPGEPGVEVPAIGLDHPTDTTGAGDAFAAGLLAQAGWQRDLAAACAAGHRAAHSLLAERDPALNSPTGSG